MESALYEQTEKCYILRQRTASAAVSVVCVLCLGLILPLEALANRWADEPQTVNAWVVAGFFFACVALAIGILRTEWGRMVIDERGIHFHRPLARSKLIVWADVQDWGIAHRRGRYTWAYALYFSTVPLALTRREKNKKLPLTYKKAVYISVEVEDLPSLQGTGVLAFCRQHLRGDKSSVKRFVPMFTSE